MTRQSADPDYVPMTKAEAKASVEDMSDFMDFYAKHKRILDFNYHVEYPCGRKWKPIETTIDILALLRG